MSTQTFENEEIKVSLQEENACQVTLDIEVNAKASHAAYKKAIKTINKEVSLPGFRKGRAPEKMIVQQFDPHIKKEAQQVIVDTAWQDALKLAKIVPLNRNSVKKASCKSFDLENGSKVEIKFERYPDVPEVKLEDLSIETVVAETVSDEMVTKRLDEQRETLAEWKNIEDRNVQKNDFVQLDVDALMNEEWKPVCQEMRFELVEGKIAPWMEKLILDQPAGAVVEGESEGEEGEETKQCKITIKTIQEKIIPELDEAFAQKIGAESVEKMHENARKKLEVEKKEEAAASMKKSLEKLLLETYTFDTPQSMLEESSHIKTINRLSKLPKNLSKEDFDKEEERIKEEVKPLAEQEVRLLFLTHQVADKEKLQISQDEMMKEFGRQQWEVKAEDSILYPDIQGEEMRSRIYLSALSEKAKAIMLEKMGCLQASE